MATAPFEPKTFKLLSFDIYGTLIDWETGIYKALLPLFNKLPSSHPNHPSTISSSEARKFILSTYTQLELATQTAHPTLPYNEILASVYTQIGSKLSLPTTSLEASEFASTIGTWSPFPDTVAAMQSLKKHYRLVALSNVDRASFSRTLAGPLKGVEFDAIYTAQDIGSYKPDLKNFEYLIEHVEREFGVKKNEIWKVAQSLLHDHRPVKTIGLRPSVWIDRKAAEGGEASMGGRLKEVEGEVTLAGIFPTLGEFAEAVDKGLAEGN